MTRLVWRVVRVPLRPFVVHLRGGIPFETAEGRDRVEELVRSVFRP